MTRLYTIIILVVLLLSSLGSGYYLYLKWREAVQESKSLVKLNGSAFKKVEYYKNKYDQEIAKNEAIELKNKSVKGLVKDGQLPELKQFKNLKRNYRNLSSLVNANVMISGAVSIPIEGTGGFVYDDTFNLVSGVIKNDTLHISDSIRVPLSVVIYWKRKWLFGKKSFYAEAFSSNPKALVTGLESIQIKKK